MNFQDLLAKIKQIDEAPMDGAGAGDECASSDVKAEPASIPGEGEFLASECGGDMGMPHEAPKQTDSVTMNVSMNGSGAGGIADLMKILRNIESSDHGHDHSDDVLVGMEADEGFEDATTVPNAQVASQDAVTPTGDDLASKGKEAIKVNGGGNPMQEGLLSHLTNLYQEIKLR